VIKEGVTLTMKALVEKFRDTARKPSGWLGKCFFKDPKGHYRSFRIIMEKLDLSSDDSYLEVACGGGQLLEMALQTVSQAAAIDHSADMVELSRKRNREAVYRGIVEIVEGKAESLPWPDGQFSCAACANAFFFMEHPTSVIGEIFRVLKPGGRLVIDTVSKETSLLSMVFTRPYGLKAYTNDEMISMLSQAGFTTVEVQTKGYMQVCYARK
jgi:ubiquinone/menaquinone biosynthesis C-methylase UbiE